jgi:dipeptidyl aminopeptidase/acylaminoacyl peptidase
MIVSDRGDWDLWALPMRGEAKPIRLVDTPAEEREGQLSPDGRWLAYASNEGGRFEIYVQPFPPTGPRWQVSREGGSQPRWRPDGGELFYLAADRAVMATLVNGSGTTFEAGGPTRLFRTQIVSLENHFAPAQYTVSSKGDTFIVSRLSDEAQSRALNVIFNWPALLKP